MFLFGYPLSPHKLTNRMSGQNRMYPGVRKCSLRGYEISGGIKKSGIALRQIIGLPIWQIFGSPDGDHLNRHADDELGNERLPVSLQRSSENVSSALKKRIYTLPRCVRICKCFFRHNRYLPESRFPPFSR